MTVRVGLDVTALITGTTGSARYVRELGAALERQGHTVARFAIGRGQHRAPAGTRRLRVPLRIVHRAWQIGRIPRGEWLAPGCDVIHVPDLVPPPTRKPLVVTIFDVDAIELPELHPPRATAMQRGQVAVARDRADVVVTISESTAQAITRLGIDRQRIVVTPLGVTAPKRPDSSAVPEGPFFLVVGGLAARKGQRELVRAFARANLGSVRLVLAGPDGFCASAVRAEIAASGVAERIECTGAVTDEQLAALYRACLAACVPSLGEGFGLPVVEAAAAGAVVVASDLPVLRELAPAVSRFVPPADDERWAAALEQLAAGGSTDDTARAAEFASGFTWDACAVATVAAYERARAHRR